MCAAIVFPDDSNFNSQNLCSVKEVETLSKNRFWLYFSDPTVHKEYYRFLRRRAEQQNYFVVVAIVNFLSLLLVFKYFMYINYTIEEISSSMTAILLVSILFTLLGFILVFTLTLLQCSSVQLCASKWFSDFHHVRQCLVLAIFICLFVANGLQLVGRAHVGECINGTPSLHCNLTPDSVPLVQFSTTIASMLYGFIACKGLLSFRVIMILWAISTTFLVCVTYMQTTPLLVLGILICACMLLFVLHVLVYQEMGMFEYHVALQKLMQQQLVRSYDQAEMDKTQLKMVLANVAHDLKTPLQAFSAGMHSLQGLMVDGGPANLESQILPNASAILKDMEAGYAFMMMQINRALDVSKTANGLNLLAKPESILLRDVVQWGLSILSSIQSSVTLKLSSKPSTILDKFILTDKVWFQENVLCLLSNAVKYSPQDSCVMVRVSVTRAVDIDAHISASVPGLDQLLVEVEDEGVGVPLDMRGKLFQPFVQTQRHAGGTGLGLYSLALRIKTLGGSCGLKSTKSGVGTIFYFSIPFNEDTSTSPIQSTVIDPTVVKDFCGRNLCLVSADAEDDLTPSNSERSFKYLSGNVPSVLLVDDSATTLKVLVRALSQAGLTVDKATDGFSALKMMKIQLYTAVIMDIQMPIMDGLESVRQLRAWEKTTKGEGGVGRHQYVIGASACTREDTQADAMGVGMDDFIHKPVDIDVIVDKFKCLHQTQLDICDIV